MSPVLEAKATMREAALEAKRVVEDAALTNAQKLEKLDKLDTDMQAASETIALHEKAAKLSGGADTTDTTDTTGTTNGVAAPGGQPREHRSIGAQVVASEQWRAMAKAIGGNAGRERYSGAVDVKSSPAPTGGTGDTDPVMTTGTGYNAGGFLDGTAGPMMVPNYLPGMVQLRFPELVIADLFPSGTTDSPIISWISEASFTNAAAPTPEGGKKPTSAATIARNFEQVGKITHLMRITDEMMQDAAQYASFLNSRMTLGLQLKEQTELLAGAGYPSVHGLMSHAGNFQAPLTAAAASNVAVAADQIYNMITNIRYLGFLNPDTILINPFDWAKIRLGKDANGQYYSGGPFTGAYGNGGYANVDSLWGQRVVQSPVVPIGAAVIGAFGQCGQLFRRQGITIEMSNSNNDDFEHNRITVRAEERLALAVYLPQGFGLVNFTWSA